MGQHTVSVYIYASLSLFMVCIYIWEYWLVYLRVYVCIYIYIWNIDLYVCMYVCIYMKCWLVSLCVSSVCIYSTHTHTHTHTYIYIYKALFPLFVYKKLIVSSVMHWKTHSCLLCNPLFSLKNHKWSNLFIFYCCPLCLYVFKWSNMCFVFVVTFGRETWWVFHC